MTATEHNLIDTLTVYRSNLVGLGRTRLELADSNTGQSGGSWHHFFRRVPETLPCLLEIRLRYLRCRVGVPPRNWIRRTLNWLYVRDVEHAIITRTDIP